MCLENAGAPREVRPERRLAVSLVQTKDVDHVVLVSMKTTVPYIFCESFL